MGIRGFGPAVSVYGVFSSLSGDTVVIDGPALVHLISAGCLRQRPAGCGFVCHPSYSLLGRMVVGWLDELRRHNVNVRNIYFDGYLPPSKWAVRQERLLGESRKMKDLVASHPVGSPCSPENAFADLKAEISLTQSFGRSAAENLPKPPFLVPAAIEALRNSQYWGPLIQVVPGEADLFCAEDVRQKGGTVLTSDSDLLIQDLGENGNVCFFGDIVPTDRFAKELGMSACKISFHDINNQLGITNVGGLTRVAFEKVNGNIPFSEALRRAKNEGTVDLPEFRGFREEHQMKDYLPSDHPVLGVLSTLDPRISEVVIQTLLMEGNGTVPGSTEEKASRGPEDLAMFLPIMIENRDQKSCWTLSADIRQVTYCILQKIARHQSAKIIEYRMLDASSALAGRQLDIPGYGETISRSVSVVNTLNKLGENFPEPAMRWFAYAVYQEVEWSAAEQRSSLSAKLVNQMTGPFGNTEEYSWDLIHFTAQVQATLYSLRMLRQVLHVVAFLDRDTSAEIQQLSGQMAPFPPIDEWPTVEGMPDLLNKFGEANAFAIITDILEIPPFEAAEAPNKTTLPKKQQKRKRGILQGQRGQESSKRSPSVNTFAILSQESQD
ncbi:Uu.00g047230.m01.CDS01 [Anthostomella pinea]|uniref:Uu.00g047230.m01.CDS01 n=1 Tax=Anthostomella pinea TaxID=933095 RepID=A0AAI8YEK1_9PEZI|nr:Uu.00g047230.m01.CDS01 [Anthostomella pinea]